MQLSPLATGAIGVTATGAGAFIAWAVGGWHGGLPDAAAGFLGSVLVSLIHAVFVRLGVEVPDAAPEQAPKQ